MAPQIDEWRNQIHQGDARETLAEMPADSVDCVMTSPPYFGLRDYGEDDQIGLEESLDEYIGRLVSVFNELQRVLKPTGSFWLNLGDSYAGGGGNAGVPDDWESKSTDRGGEIYPDEPPARNTEFPAKCKMMVPHRVAIALVDSGWILRSDAVWAKPNPMPSSVKDRFNETKEFVFHFAQQGEYYFDLDAIREPYSESMKRREHCQSKHGGAERDGWGGGNHHEGGLLDDSKTYGDTMHPNGKNPGDVLDVTVMPYPDAHFAVYPKELCQKPIKATCPDDGVVLDPFAGAGTTCLAAKEIGRDFVGIDLNPEYVAMAQARVGVDVDQPELLDDDHTPLTAFTDGGQRQ